MEAKGNTIGVVWGTKDKSLADDVAGSGIIQRAQKVIDGKTTEIPNGDGDTIIAILHDENTTLDLEVITATSGAGASTIPDRGATIEICAVECCVLRVETLWQTSKEHTFKVSAKAWALIDLTPA